jgi:hypothetical protein
MTYDSPEAWGATRPRLVRLDHAQWESAVRSFSDYSYRQTWAYGSTLASKRGALSEHLAIQAGDEVIGLADVRIKQLPLVGGGLAYVSGGPLIRSCDGSGDALDRFDKCIELLTDEFVGRRGLTFRALAPIGLADDNDALAERFAKAGLAPTEHGEHYRTVLLDLEPEPEEIRTSLHRHWRRQLNRAERNDLEVSFGTEPGRFEEVARMSEALRARKGFNLDLDAGFYGEVQEGLSDRDRLVVGLVHAGGEVVAGNITAVHGDTAVYLVGASNDAGRESRAAYLMHWRTLELIRERGLRWYDLGGIDPVANPGVSSFKLRTNGFDVTAAGPYEKSPGGVRASLARWAERAVRRVQRKDSPARAR